MGLTCEIGCFGGVLSSGVRKNTLISRAPRYTASHTTFLGVFLHYFALFLVYFYRYFSCFMLL